MPARYHEHDDVFIHNDHHHLTNYHVVALCTDDDCPRDHVHIVDVNELAERFVERPRWHDPDDYAGGFHDHDGDTVWHAHIESTGSVLYHEGARLIPGPGDTDPGAAP